MRPGPVEPEPEPEPAPVPEASEPEIGVAPVAPAATAAIAAVAAEPPADFWSGEDETRRSRSEARRQRDRRLKWLLGGAAVLLLVLGAVLVLRPGDDDSNAVRAVNPSDVTTAAPTTAAPTTAPTTAAPTTAPAAQRQTTPAGTSVTVNADVLFDVGSSELSSNASGRLGAVLELARTDTSRKLLIEGFTDSDGGAASNQTLSEARAESVARWLADQGIDTGRITTVGHGASNFVAPNDTPANKALNRRVVVTLLTAGTTATTRP